MILNAAEIDRLQSAPWSEPLVAFLETLHLDGLHLTRRHDRGRDVLLTGAALFDPWSDDAAEFPVTP